MLAHLGAILDQPGRILAHLRPSWRHLGPSWRHLGRLLALLGALLGHLGALLGNLGAILSATRPKKKTDTKMTQNLPRPFWLVDAG